MDKEQKRRNRRERKWKKKTGAAKQIKSNQILIG
jgi:hypothetical protein